MCRKMKIFTRRNELFFFVLGSILLLSIMSLNIDSAYALKSEGTKKLKFGKDTSSIVCGDKLCSEIQKDDGRGDIYQQSADDEGSPLLAFDFNLEDEGIIIIEDNGFLKLERDDTGILRVTEPKTDILRALTITAWAKPNLSESYGEYSLVSKERSFELSFDNLNYPKKNAKFSIFDGMSWTTIKSKNILPETWFHVASVYERDTVSLFINGKYEGTEKIQPIRKVNSEGKLVEGVVNKITSDKDVVIGAYINTLLSGAEEIKNRYAGALDDIEIFNVALDEEEISSIFSSKADFYKNRPFEEPIIEEEDDDGFLD